MYVDDGRQVTSLLAKGMRYARESRSFEWSKEAEDEDLEREKKGEGKGAFMARLCLPAMNDVNPDLTFTAEVEEDFESRKLPTLDTNMWMEEDGKISNNKLGLSWAKLSCQLGFGCTVINICCCILI